MFGGERKGKKEKKRKKMKERAKRENGKSFLLVLVAMGTTAAAITQASAAGG